MSATAPDPRFVCQADGYEVAHQQVFRGLDGTVLCVACAHGVPEATP